MNTCVIPLWELVREAQIFRVPVVELLPEVDDLCQCCGMFARTEWSPLIHLIFVLLYSPPDALQLRKN